MASSHLILEEAGKQQTLRACCLHHGRILTHRLGPDEVIEHCTEVCRRGQIDQSLRRHLGVMCQHAGVVEQLLTVDVLLAHVLEAKDEELQRLPMRRREQFVQWLHGFTRSAPTRRTASRFDWVIGNPRASPSP